MTIWNVNEHAHSSFGKAVACTACQMIPRPFPPDLPKHERRRAVGEVLDQIEVVSHRAGTAMSQVKEDQYHMDLLRLREFIHIWTGTD
jgi:hypothetical protein